ncbi:MAG: ABC transporter permease [Pseudomonadota bacterium]
MKSLLQPANRIALQAILSKEIARYIRIWPQTLLPPAITTTLYFMIFGNFVGSRIGSLDGVSYMAYILPGLVMMSVITNSYANVVSSFFSAKFQRSIEELLVAPVPNSVLLLGYVLGGVSRGLLTAIIVIALSLFFVPLQVQHWGLMLLLVLLASALFSLGGFINAVYAKKFDDTSIIPTFVLTPLTYLGGVFYSISWLPDIWQTISHFNPVLYLVNAFRYSFMGRSDVSIGLAFAILTTGLMLLAGYAMWLLRRGTGLRS